MQDADEDLWQSNVFHSCWASLAVHTGVLGTGKVAEVYSWFAPATNWILQQRFLERESGQRKTHLVSSYSEPSSQGLEPPLEYYTPVRLEVANVRVPHIIQTTLSPPGIIDAIWRVSSRASPFVEAFASALIEIASLTPLTHMHNVNPDVLSCIAQVYTATIVDLYQMSRALPLLQVFD